MDYQKLIFAAHVNEIAKSLRAAERQQVWKDTEGMMQSERELAMAAWEEKAELDLYIKPAVAHLSHVSEVIDGLQNEADEARRQEYVEAMRRSISG